MIFSAFERLVAFRYLRARREEGFVSVIAAFSLAGIAIGVAALWLVFTSMHLIAPEERGVVTRFGRYSSTLSPGISLTLPSPIDRVQKVNVEEIRNEDIGSAAEETLMLTSDQNLIDIAYQVRWNIRDPEQYLFELAAPEETIRQVAESAMRQIVSQVALQDAMGVARGDIEARVQEEMQQTLDAYRSGVVIQGVAIKQAVLAGDIVVGVGNMGGAIAANLLARWWGDVAEGS